MAELIDISRWKRSELFSFYSSLSDPFYTVTFTMDVGDLLSFVKANKLSFYYSLIYCCAKAVNSIDAFRYVIRDDSVYMIDRRDPSFTDMKPDSDLFHITTVPMADDIRQFCAFARERSMEQKRFIDSEKETDELIFFTSLPWIRLTALTNCRDRSDPAYKNDSVPRISWGKYEFINGRACLGMSLEVNHRLIDGYHIGLFADSLEKIMKDAAKT